MTPLLGGKVHLGLVIEGPDRSVLLVEPFGSAYGTVPPVDILQCLYRFFRFSLCTVSYHTFRCVCKKKAKVVSLGFFDIGFRG